MKEMKKIFIIVCISLCFLCHIDTKKITVNPDIGNNSLACLQGVFPCADVDYVLSIQGQEYLNNSIVTLMTGEYNISENHQLSFIHNFSMQSDSAILKCNKKNSGLTFLGCENIMLQNLTFINCSAKHKSTTVFQNLTTTILYRPNIYIAVTFMFCKDIFIYQCDFFDNSGIGLAMYNPGKRLHISHCMFINNSNVNSHNSSDPFISGGGIYIEYTLCDALAPYTCNQFEEYNRNAQIDITQSIFSSNIADNRYGLSRSEEKLNSSYFTFGDGGGVSVNFFGNALQNVIHINSCKFVNNSAMWGAGLCVTLKDQAESNAVIVNNSNFYGNSATYAGGGVRIESLYPQDFEDADDGAASTGNSINFYNSEYSDNFAILGGGISITATTRIIYIKSKSSRDVIVDNCTFTHNKATVGYAIGLNTINLNKEIVGPGMSYRVHIKNSFFSRNVMVLTEDRKVIGHGSLYSDQVTLVFSGENHFIANKMSAIVLDSSSLYFDKNSSTNFIKNAGFEGAAISLFGLSWLMLGKNSNILFKNNMAQSKGGAIYVKPGSPPRIAFNTTLLSTIQCFIRYENHNFEPNNWPVNVVFDGNQAPNGTGNSVYASTLQFCRTFGSSRENIKALNWRPFSYIHNFLGQSEIVTNAIELSVNTLEWNPSPFLPFSPQVQMLDEKRQSVFASVKLRLSGNQGVRLDPPNNNFLIRNKLARLRMIGKVKAKFAFQFISTSGQLFRSPKFNGSMHQCPPGFRPNRSGDRCVCMDAENSDVIKCYENGTVFILKGKWAYLNKDNGILETVSCPPHVCRCKNELADYLCELDLQDQCILGRHGTLCGECKKGLSVLLGNEECDECNNTILYIIIVCLVIGMPVFIMFILYYDFDAFSGYLNAFLYSCQMSTILITESVDLDPVISFIIGITSFAGTGGNFGICLYDGMDNIQKLGLNYVLPGSLIIFTYIIGMKTPDSLWRFIFNRKTAKGMTDDSDGNEVRRRSFGRAFGFVSVLCYSSITETTFRIFRFVRINEKAYVFGAPGNEYFSNIHIALFTVACILGLFVILGFPFLLIFQTRFANKYLFFRKIDFIVTALKSCFKIKYHYFAAFYFTCRFILLLIDTLVEEQISKLIVLSCCCVIILVVFNYFQPYELWTYNLFDVLMLSNLTLLSLLSIILNVPFSLEDDDRDKVAVLCAVLIWVPVAITLLRLFYWLYLTRKEKPPPDEADEHQDKLIVHVPSRALEGINT